MAIGLALVGVEAHLLNHNSQESDGRIPMLQSPVITAEPTAPQLTSKQTTLPEPKPNTPQPTTKTRGTLVAQEPPIQTGPTSQVRQNVERGRQFVQYIKS